MRVERRSHMRALGALGVVALGLMAGPALARVTSPIRPSKRDIHLAHLHTAERIGVVFAADGAYLDSALAQLNHFLRDHHSQQVGVMDPLLYDLLHRLRAELGSRAAYDVISAYRSPVTNERLRARGGGGVAARSLHMDGKAIDIRLPGVPLADLRQAAVSLRAGGVGYYPRENFVHIDTGRVRVW